MLRDNVTPSRKVLRLIGALLLVLICIARADEVLCKNVPNIKVLDPLHESAADQDATFERVWVEHNVRVDGKRGMRIHAKFTVKNSLNVSCRLIAQFYKRDGIYLEADRYPGYTTSEGHVYTYVDIKPSFKSTEYADKALFIPYAAFNIKQRGLYLLKFVLFLDRDGQTLGHSADFNFKYTKDTQ